MENRSIWHVVALIATLGLAALVAVVAVTRGDRRDEPSAEPSPSVTASASPSASPGLSGDGPFVVYALGNEILAFDVAGGKSISLGRVDEDPAVGLKGQPGSGRLVAFTLADGDLWTITRKGLAHVTAIPPAAGSEFLGALPSTDDRKVAVATTGAEPTIVVVDLQTRKPTTLKRTKRGQYPDLPLLPVGWSLGGTVLYTIPYCDGCDSGGLGLYALDTTTGASTRVGGTSSTTFVDLAVAPSGQALYYSTSTRRSCPEGNLGKPSCDGPPFYLRRLAAGATGSDIIRRASDYPFRVNAISQGADLILVTRLLSATGDDERVELYSVAGERQPAPRGVPAGGALGIAILPRDVFVIATSVEDRTAFVLLKDGAATTITQQPETGERPRYLGWLR